MVKFKAVVRKFSNSYVVTIPYYHVKDGPIKKGKEYKVEIKK